MAKKVFIGDKVAPIVNTGGVTVNTVPVQLRAQSRDLAGGVQVVSDADNIGICFIGTRPNITAGADNVLDGFPLSPGESLFLPVQHESEVYLISDTAGQTVHFVSF